MTYGVEKQLTPNGFSRTGFFFNGWNTKADGSGSSYGNMASVKFIPGASDGGIVTLYAQWHSNTPSPSKYTVKFNGNGNTGGTMSDQSMTSGVSTTLNANKFTRTGYVFICWNTKADGSGESYFDEQSVSSLTTTDGGIVTLYAQWYSSQFTVVFNGNGNTNGTMSNQSITFGEATTLNANAFSKTNYVFKCWNTKADGSGESYADKQSVSGLAFAGETVTLYAQWNYAPYPTSNVQVIATYGGNLSDKFGVQVYQNGAYSDGCSPGSYKMNVSNSWESSKTWKVGDFLEIRVYVDAKFTFDSFYTNTDKSHVDYLGSMKDGEWNIFYFTYTVGGDISSPAIGITVK